jgi:outer membrane protein OmpA-like peptidoglycan-associated protein
MNTVLTKSVGTLGLICMSAAAWADEPKPATPHEPIGFVTGGVIGGFAAGPIGAVIGAGLGTWLGNRVHRAGDAAKAEATVAALQTDKASLLTDQTKLQEEKSALLDAETALAETNRRLSVQLQDAAHQAQTAESVSASGSEVLDGLEGDVLFRTGSAEITPEIAHRILVLAQAVAKTADLKVRVDGYADPRGSEDANMKLSQARANAVRDLFLAAGISEQLLEVNAFGKSQSVAADSDGYAFERRVRLTLQAQAEPQVAKTGNGR